MLIRITQITVGSACIALALIKRNLQHAHHFVLAILGDVFKTGESRLAPIICHIEETTHQLALIPVDAAYQGKLAHTLQLSIAVDIEQDVFYLRCGKKRHALKFFSRCRIQIGGMLRHLLQIFFIVLPGYILEIFGCRKVGQQLLPGWRSGKRIFRHGALF